MILDVCCGSKMFWYDKQNENAIFGDVRSESHVLCDGRRLEIKPDVLFDFRALPFRNNQFKLIVFDPPHLERAGKKSWMALKYGVLGNDWRMDLEQGFSECFRVLDNFGTLIFKWNESQIKVSEILKLTDYKPAVGHRSGRNSGTHWVSFLKG